MADDPFMISRRALFEALGNDRVARAIERLLQDAMARMVAEVVLAVASPDAFPAGRTLIAGTGIVIDVSVDGQLTISATPMADPFEVGSLHASDDISADDDINAGGDIRAIGEIRGGTLRLDGVPSAFVGVADFTLPVTIDGTTYYLALSSTP